MNLSHLNAIRPSGNPTIRQQKDVEKTHGTTIFSKPRKTTTTKRKINKKINMN